MKSTRVSSSCKRLIPWTVFPIRCERTKGSVRSIVYQMVFPLLFLKPHGIRCKHYFLPITVRENDCRTMSYEPASKRLRLGLLRTLPSSAPNGRPKTSPSFLQIKETTNHETIRL